MQSEQMQESTRNQRRRRSPNQPMTTAPSQDSTKPTQQQSTSSEQRAITVQTFALKCGAVSGCARNGAVPALFGTAPSALEPRFGGVVGASEGAGAPKGVSLGVDSGFLSAERAWARRGRSIGSRPRFGGGDARRGRGADLNPVCVSVAVSVV